MPTPSFSDSDLATTREPQTGSLDRRAFYVLIREERSSRSQLIKKLVAEGGAHPLQAMDRSTLAKLASLQCFVALVGLEGCPAASSPALTEVRELANSGLTVLCYADQVRTWPLRNRCNVLLAGGFKLFDSAMPEFAQELNSMLTEVLRLQRSRRDEDARMKSVMKELGLIGESKIMRSIFRWVEKAGTLSDLPALITGETGTGKELIVNAIHRLDRKRCTGPFVALNCGAITAGVAESEFFGHRRGAFTGAGRDRKGLIRAADRGTLFLDEIGDLDWALQSKLLRVLQENRVLGVGEDQEQPVNVRVIAATNRDLEEMVRRGEFRDDLFHRLNLLSLHIPALRNRPADLTPLVNHFVEKHRDLSGESCPAVDPEFIEALAQLDLPGNAREVENLVRRALVNKISGCPLSLSDLAPAVLERLAKQKSSLPRDSSPAKDDGSSLLRQVPERSDYDKSLFEMLQLNEGSLARTMQHCERLLIASALERSNGNQSSTAKLLGITPRSVYNKLRKHDLR